MVFDLVSPQMATEFRPKLGAAAAAVGRAAPRLAAWIPAAVDPDPASSAQLMWSLVGYLGDAEMFRAAGFGRAVDLAAEGAPDQERYDALPDDAARRVGLVGDTDAVGSRLAAYADADLDEVVVVPATAGDPAADRTLTALASLR